MQELIPPHKRTVELTFKIFRVRRKEKKVLKFLKKGIEYKGRRKHSSAGMSVRLTRERSWVRAPLLPFFGALAQLGARHIRIVEAVGSTPICSSMFKSR